MFSETEQSTRHMSRAYIFAEVVRAGSLTAAAAHLGLSKSAVSAQLKELEEFVGARLIERTTRTHHLTDAGRRFLPRVHSMLGIWREGLREVKAALAEPVGTLRITVPSYLYTTVGRAITTFAKRYPGVDVHAHVSDQRHSMESGEFDMALRMAGQVKEAGLHVTKLGSDHDIIVATPSLAAELPGVERPDQLVHARWIVHAELPQTRTFECTDGETIELSMPRNIVAGSGPVMRTLALEDAGVAVMPRTLVREDLASGRLLQLLPEWHCGVINLFALSQPDTANSPKVRRFTEILQEQL